MKAIKQITSAILAVLLLTLVFIPLIPATAVSSAGLTFSADTLYAPSRAYAQSLNTFEAIVNFPTSMNSSTRGGIIFGNFGQANPVVNFEVHANGSPRLYITDASGNVTDLNFKQINLYNGKDTHVAIVRDAKNAKAYCYIDGELKQTLNCAYTADIKTATPLNFGGDARSANEQYFKGSIISASLYSTARSASQIKDDCDNKIPYDTDMVAWYDTSDLENNIIPDLSGNGYDLLREETWFTEKEPVTDYAYSFAVVGDTQIIAKHHPDKFHKIYDYIVDNIESKNIQFVMGLGDITDGDSDAEWSIATENISKLDGKVGYSIVRGNHDSTTKFINNFPLSKYSDVIGGSYDKTMLNTWQELIVGEVKYLIFTFDYGASDKVLNWAGDIIAAHPEHNVIITTHAYLYRDGTTLDQGDVCPPATTGGHNNGDHIWDKLIKQYENIVLVISGHDPCNRVIMAQTEGNNGNVVTQLLIDPQGLDSAVGGTGMVALLHFSEDGKDVTVEYYSTIREEYFMTSNQFSFSLDLAGDEVTVPPEKIEEPEKKPKPTQKPTEKVTETHTEQITEALTEAPTEATEEKSGCGAMISTGIIALLPSLAFASSVVLKRKKKN